MYQISFLMTEISFYPSINQVVYWNKSGTLP